MHRTRVSVAAGLAIALIGLAIPAVALAHAELRTTVPDAGERLASGPSEVVLVFEGELDADGSRFTVAAADGEVVGEGGVDLTVAERNEMRGAVSAADPGSYTVEWQSRSIDGHEERGEFTFSVGATSPNTAMARPELAASPTTAQALLLLIAIGLVVRAALRRESAVSARIAAALLVAMVALSGCITPTSGCEQLPTTVDVTLSADTLTPPDPTVCRDRDVTLVVTAEVDGVLHIHGYDTEIPATPVTAGERTELAFTASRSGQFPIELHTDGVAEGTPVGILTVNEP